MPKPTREDLTMKLPALVHLSRLGYTPPSREALWKRDRETNILPDTLRRSLERINGKAMPAEELTRLLSLMRISLDAEDLGKRFYHLIRNGWEGWKILDFESPERNCFQAAPEVACSHGRSRFRPDLTLYVNGLPLGMAEVKTGDQPRGIRAEYDRMRKRFRNGDFRKFLQCVQVWVFSDDRDFSPERLLPTEGAFYATGGREDFPIYAFQETHPSVYRQVKKLSGEAVRQILTENGLPEPPRSREFRNSLSPRKEFHRLLTSLFLPERFLFLLRYGVRYGLEADDRGRLQGSKRLLTSGQLLALWDLKRKAARGYRSCTLPLRGAAGEGAMLSGLFSLLEDQMPGAGKCWLIPDGKERQRIRDELRMWEERNAPGTERRDPGQETGGAGSETDRGIANPAEPRERKGGSPVFPERPEDWLKTGTGKAPGEWIFLLSETGAGYGAGGEWRRRIRRARPGAKVISLLSEKAPEGGNVAYLLECADGTLYCGWTNDLAHRLRTHNEGKGAKYTRSRLPVKLVYYEAFETKEEAMSREWHLKRMSREQKLRLIREGKDGR